MKRLFLSLVLFVAFFSVKSQDLFNLKPTGYVNDYEKVFTPEQDSTLEKFLSNYEKLTSIEICVATSSDFDFSQQIIASEMSRINISQISPLKTKIFSKNQKLLRTYSSLFVSKEYYSSEELERLLEKRLRDFLVVLRQHYSLCNFQYEAPFYLLPSPEQLITGFFDFEGVVTVNNENLVIFDQPISTYYFVSSFIFLYINFLIIILVFPRDENSLV